MGFTPPTTAQGAGLFSAVGGLIEGAGGFLESRAESNLGESRAAVYEQQAQATRQSQILLESQKRRIIASRAGQQVSAVAGSGIKMSGSPLALLADSLANAEMDLAIDKYNSEVDARRATNAAGMERFEARQRSARSSFSAGRSFLGTAANLYMSQREIGGGGKI